MKNSKLIPLPTMKAIATLRMRLALILTLALCLLHFRGGAEIPEPDNVLWGAVVLANQPVTSADSEIVVEARKTANGPVVASYRMGEAPAYGNFYSLRIPIEAFLPLSDTNASRIGGLVYLVVRDGSGIRDQRTASIASRGRFTRLDFVELDTDGDGLPDRWEQQYFGSPTSGNPNADPDGDGRSNLSEFLGQTNPLFPDGRHPADFAPADNALTLAELEDYTTAWLNGDVWSVEPTNIPIAYVTRAAALWLGGENYVFTNAPPTNAPMWWVNVPRLAAPPAIGTNVVVGQLPATHPWSQTLFVPINVFPRESVLVYAVEDAVPAGWTVLDISHGGVFDNVNRKVKWGPFFDSGERALFYQATPPPTNALAAFVGTASLDGLNIAFGPRQVTLTGAGGLLRFLSATQDALGPNFVLSGQPSTTYVIEASTNLVQWSMLQSITMDVTGRQLFRPANPSHARHRFFRARTP